MVAHVEIQRSRGTLLGIGLFLLALALGLVALVSWPMFAPTVPRGGGSTTAGLGTILLVDLGLVLGCGCVFAIPLTSYLTRFDSDGIRQPAVTGEVFVRWSEVRDVVRRGHWLVIRSREHTIRINTLLFKQPDELVRLVHTRTVGP